MKYLFPLIFYLTIQLSVFSQDFTYLTKKSNEFVESNYFNKIYLHTDKNYYYANENLWFKAYLYNDLTSKLDSIDNIIVVELISIQNKIVSVNNFLSKNGMVWGNILLSDSLLEGTYQIRAYTNTMKNYSSKYFFTDYIYIETSNNVLNYENYKFIKYKNKNAKKIYGNIKSEYSNNNLYLYTYFKDHSINKVFVKNKKNTISTNIDSLKGLYILRINIDSLPKSKLIIQKQKKQKKLSLKKVIPNYQQFTYSLLENKLIFHINQDLLKQSNEKYLFVCFKAGQIIFSKELENIKDCIIEFSEKNLPKGILTFAVLNYKKETIYELNYYNKRKNEEVKVIHLQQNDTLEIEFEGLKNDIYHLSLSISTKSSSANIIDYFDFYSDIDFINLKFSLDNTHIYTLNSFLKMFNLKYSIQDVINYESKELKYKVKNCLSIEGFISNFIEKLPATGAIITLSVLSAYNDYFETTTDINGRFKFDNLMYYDSVEYLLEAKTKNDKNHVVIQVDSYDTNQIYFSDYYYEQFDFKNYIVKEKLKPKQENTSSIHKNADIIFYNDEISRSMTDNILTFLSSRVPGLTQHGSSTIIRGYSSINLSSEPLYLIDDMPSDAFAFSNININDIERVEVIKGSSKSAIYGQRGSNGVIAIYTKKGYNIDWGICHLKTTGIKTPSQFFTHQNTKRYNTFLWIPEFNISKKNNIIKVPINKNTNNYVIKIEGISENGDLFSKIIYI